MLTGHQFATQWLAGNKPETATGTSASYERVIEVFTAFLGEKSTRDLSEITRTDLINFRNELATKISSGTVNRYMQTLRTIFKAAQRDHYLIENPVEHVELVKDSGYGNGSRRPFTIAEIKSILRIADPEWQSLIKFGLYTGQRLGDLALLTWKNIDLEHNELCLTTQKTGKHLIIPLGASLRAHIDSLEHPARLDVPFCTPERTRSLYGLARSLRLAVGLPTCLHKLACVKNPAMMPRGSVATPNARLALSLSTPFAIRQSHCSKMPGYRKRASKS